MSDSLIIALMTMLATMIATVFGLGWKLSQLFAQQKEHFRAELAARDVRNEQARGDLRNDFQKALSETRHTLYGRFEQQVQIQKDKDEDQDRALHAIEVRLARAGVNGLVPIGRPKPTRTD